MVCHLRVRPWVFSSRMFPAIDPPWSRSVDLSLKLHLDGKRALLHWPAVRPGTHDQPLSCGETSLDLAASKVPLLISRQVAISLHSRKYIDNRQVNIYSQTRRHFFAPCIGEGSLRSLLWQDYCHSNLPVQLARESSLILRMARALIGC
jgi:hypothetical protein